jgi:hypothetical protein
MLLAYDKHAAFKWALPFLGKNLVIVYGHAQPKRKAGFINWTPKKERPK